MLHLVRNDRWKNLSEIRDEVFNRGVGYIAGDMFAPNGDGQNMARLCFAFEPIEKIMKEL